MHLEPKAELLLVRLEPLRQLHLENQDDSVVIFLVDKALVSLT